MKPASADSGFFQRVPVLKNQFLHDPSIKRVFKLFVPQDVAKAVAPEITRLGDEVLTPQIFDWVTDAERNQPYVAGGGKDAFGQPVSSKLVVTEGWRKLQDFNIEKGFSSQGYEDGLGQYTRVIIYLRVLLFESSSANVGCPAAMTDGAARVLQTQIRSNTLPPDQKAVFQNAYDHLVSRDPRKAWTSGQWMTERPGGSDVSLSETVATYSPLPTNATACDPSAGIPLGPWCIDGFKWFSSATDSNMTILLAQTPKGLSCFYAPTHRYNPTLLTSPTGETGGTQLNGISISRLKNKLGTKPLPTAELELHNMRAWLIGKEGEGIKQIATILTITRIRSAVSALGHVNRGLAIARSFAEAREVGAGRGKRTKLTDSALHMRTLADMTVEYHAMTLLCFYCSYLLGTAEHASSPCPPPSGIVPITPSSRLVTPLLRVLTPLLKAYVTKQSIPLLYACMESLGGVGYLENAESQHINIARLFRDACVLNIWEGTTDVLATDLIRALKHPKGGTASIQALDMVINQGCTNTRSGMVADRWATLKARLESNTQEDLLYYARDVMWGLAEILMAVLLALDAESDNSEVAREMCRRYYEKKGFQGSPKQSAGLVTHRASLEMNQLIVFGIDGQQHSVSKL
ncbi:very-long-chain acyl-CoA dehydrogenase [Xylariaceae sp. FL1272]|nr:very-long-chain acyl-CoA dehydrogenase [Xylariaceae sp. FL1272]